MMKMERHINPAQVLDLQADLMVRLQDKPWREVMKYQLAMDMKENPDNRAQRYSAQILERVHGEIQQAAAYYVAPEMTDLVTWASAGLDETDKFRIDELPTDRGFAYFENPLILKDIHDVDLLINGALWFKVLVKFGSGKPSELTTPGVMVLFFNDAQVTPDSIAIDLRERGYSLNGSGRWGLVGAQFIADQLEVGPSMLNPSQVDKEEYGNKELSMFTNVVRIMHAYWMLLGQEVTFKGEAEIPRAFSKRARKMSIPDRVTIVALRRYAGHSHGDTDVEWQHRWYVRGHWRWQHVSEHHELAEPDGEGGYRARIWIRPHIKGPEDKPFVLTEKVYALVR